jgi:hypothetical protein
MMLAEFTGQYVRGADRLLPKKYGAFHLLSFKPSSKLELGLYEGIIFNRPNGFELNYLNPMIFYHSIEHALGSADNVFMGFQAKYNLNEHTQFYTQLLLDDLQVGQFTKGTGWWGNKYGIQLGSRFVNIFKIPNLDGQLEFNMVRPYTYSHYSGGTKRHFMSLRFLIFAIKFSDMKNQSVKENTAELKKEIKKTFESMIQDVMKGKVSIQEFTQKINYNYAQKKMEISGTLF